MTKETQQNKYLDIRIPFCGFYESEASYIIDEEIERSFDYEGTGVSEIPDDFWDYWTSGNRKVSKAFCEAYVPMFSEYFEDTTEIKLPLKFVEMTSPKFYNYETDKIYCSIHIDDVIQLRKKVEESSLREVINERHSHRSGFISFYSNCLNEGEWSKPVEEWDEIQLETLLLAHLRQNGIEFIDYWSLFNDYGMNEQAHMIVWNNCSQKCLDMINEYDERMRG